MLGGVNGGMRIQDDGDCVTFDQGSPESQLQSSGGNINKENQQFNANFQRSHSIHALQTESFTFNNSSKAHKGLEMSHKLLSRAAKLGDTGNLSQSLESFVN